MMAAVGQWHIHDEKHVEPLSAQRQALGSQVQAPSVWLVRHLGHLQACQARQAGLGPEGHGRHMLLARRGQLVDALRTWVCCMPGSSPCGSSVPWDIRVGHSAQAMAR